MLAVGLLFALAQEVPVPTFGTTVYNNSGFTGMVYHVPPATAAWANLRTLRLAEL